MDHLAGLAVKQRGKGSALVLLHGLFGNADNLAMLARALDTDFEVSSFDLPAHGKSPVLDSMQLTDMALALDEAMVAGGLDQAHIVGHSLGGKVAMQLASLRPDHLASLCVLDIAPVAYQASHQTIFAAAAEIDSADVGSRKEADQLLAKHIKDLGVRQFIMTNLRKSEEAGYFWRLDFKRLEAEYSNFLAAPELVSTFDGPVLVIKGANSNYIMPEHESAFRDRFPAVQFRIVEGVGHWLHAEKPELVSSIVHRFLIGLR